MPLCFDREWSSITGVWSPGETRAMNNEREGKDFQLEKKTTKRNWRDTDCCTTWQRKEDVPTSSHFEKPCCSVLEEGMAYISAYERYRKNLKATARTTELGEGHLGVCTIQCTLRRQCYTNQNAPRFPEVDWQGGFVNRFTNSCSHAGGAGGVAAVVFEVHYYWWNMFNLLYAATWRRIRSLRSSNRLPHLSKLSRICGISSDVELLTVVKSCAKYCWRCCK